jgi:hypothetical protein
MNPTMILPNLKILPTNQNFGVIIGLAVFLNFEQQIRIDLRV